MNEILFYIFLFIFGTLFGSFASVLLYRLKSGESGIMTGRSHCGSCNTTLKAINLVPLFSWLLSKGKCMYCKSKISAIYPSLELATGLLFAAIGYFLIDVSAIVSGNMYEIITLLAWLVIGFITILYIFYDILYLEIHEGVMLSGVGVIFAMVVTQMFVPGLDFFPYLGTISEVNISTQIFSIVLSLGILGILYLIMLKGLDEKIDLVLLLATIGSLFLFKYIFQVEVTQIIILNAMIGVLAIFTFFFLQIFVSGGAWLGGGDLRIAIMIGLGLGVSLSFAGMMLTYFAGTIISLIYLAVMKMKHKGKSFDTQIPFGPFLAIGFFLTMFYQNEIISLMEIYF